jgi:2-methylcitrate dehydratase
MTAMNTRQPEDQLLQALARMTCAVSDQLGASVARATKAALMDALGVALGALSHPASQVARRYARHAVVEHGATLWGTGQRVTVETAALVNGVPLRGYDYNDLYIGKSGGHPSDMIPGLIALAEWRQLPAASLLGAIALGYEVALDLLDAIDLDAHGWDYPNVIAIGATCAAARLLRLSEMQTREALAITVIAHCASDEVESGDLNARGDLTMWKRFNGSDAVRHSVYACLLAEAEAEGAVRPFEGRSGFLSKVVTTTADLETLFRRLEPGRPLGRISEVTFKRWPVGSRAQSAIQATLQARAAITDIWQVKEIRVFSDEQVFDHLVRRRADPWHPTSRETADHSLPYIVAAAALDGEVKVNTFDLDRVLDPMRQKFLVEKVSAKPSPELSRGAAGGFLTRVEIVDADGRIAVGEAKAPPGHMDQPFSEAELEQKFHENVAPLFGAARVSQLIQTIWSLEEMHDLRALTAQLILDQPAAIDIVPPSSAPGHGD